jgi:DNA-binding MarR family transcriptional regulator
VASDVRRVEAERFGQAFEALGFVPMAGRLFAWLVTSRDDHETAASLAEGLGVSAASVSTTVRSLIQLGLVERVPVPGERRDCYRLHRDAWRELLLRRLRVAATMRDLATDAADRLEGDPEARVDGLRAMASFYDAADRAVVPAIEALLASPAVGPPADPRPPTPVRRARRGAPGR